MRDWRDYFLDLVGGRPRCLGCPETFTRNSRYQDWVRLQGLLELMPSDLLNGLFEMRYGSPNYLKFMGVNPPEPNRFVRIIRKLDRFRIQDWDNHFLGVVGKDTLLCCLPKKLYMDSLYQDWVRFRGVFGLISSDFLMRFHRIWKGQFQRRYGSPNTL